MHNLGAVATLGGSLSAVALKNSKAQKKLAWIAFGGWGVQGLSGAAFGVVSYYFYRSFPDIAGIAVFALAIKIICSAVGFVLLLSNLARWANCTDEKKDGVLMASSLLAVVALTAAAFLRWFS
ncbi:MAG: hypothetical protein ACXVCE_06620 [Bacteriovorax sp.]